MKIGVFDSGVGGVSVANAIKKDLPDHQVILREDSEHIPYGTRHPHELLGLVVPIIQQLVDEGCQIIVVACNTVSTTLMTDLRRQFSIPMISVEPMIKPAGELTKTGVIAVCATPTTLASAHYNELKALFAEDLTVLEPDCSDWALMIEHQKLQDERITELIREVLSKNADVIVLGCTHYHWIEDKIDQLAAGRAKVLQPEPIIVAELKQVLAQLG